MKKVVSVVLMMILLLPCMVKAEALSENDEQVQNLYKKYIEKALFLPSYVDGKFNLETADNLNKAKLVSYYGNISNTSESTDSKTGVTTETIASQVWDEAYHAYFGPDETVAKITKGEKSSCLVFEYDSTSNNYQRAMSCGLAVGPLGSYIDSASKQETTITLNIKLYEFNQDKNTILLGNENISVPSFDKKSLEKYNAYLNTYKYVFKKASDNNYYFYSVENMKDAKEYKVSTTANTNTKTTTTKKVSNPNTADKNIVLLLTTGIIMFAIILYSGKKLFVRR